MSTLTTSPSPVASPRPGFLVQRRCSTDRAPRSSPRLSYTSASSPRRPFYAPPPRTVVTVASGSGARKLGEGSVDGPGVSESNRVRYAHASTQYSPDGLPPTARQAVTASVTGEAPGSVESGARKRKDRGSQSEIDIMQNIHHTAVRQSAPVPSEPEVRQDPVPNIEQPSSSGGPSKQEPQEARSTHGHSSAPKRPRSESGSVKVMPQRYWTCDPKDLGRLIASMLLELIRLNDQIPLRDGRLTRFHSRAPPGISVADYLQRLIHHATLSPPILLSMVWYIDRLCQLYPAFTINSLTVHRFLITAATVAAKGLSDSFWTNPTYARIGGIPVSELATLELEFLQKVQWKIVPRPETLEEYYRSLVERTDGHELEQSESESVSSGDMDEVDEDKDEVMRDEPK